MSEKLKSVEGVEQVVPRLKFGAMISLEDELVGMMGWGIDPLEEIKFMGIDKNITEGRIVQEGNKEVVMGAEEKSLKDMQGPAAPRRRKVLVKRYRISPRT